MIIFQYDATFEGLLTALFDAYFRRTFPDLLLAEKEPLPLFYDESHRVITDMTKAERVWKLLTRKLSRSALSCLTYCWLSETPEAPMLLFRYMRKVTDASRSIEQNFADPDVLGVYQLSKKWQANGCGYFSSCASKRPPTRLILVSWNRYTMYIR